MLLAGDVGGTKTFLGLFARGAARPDACRARAPIARSTSPILGRCLCSFCATRRRTQPTSKPRASASPVPCNGTRAQLTNVPWVVDVDALRRDVPDSACASAERSRSAGVVGAGAHDRRDRSAARRRAPTPQGNVALIAAGTGLGIALLPNVDGRLVPRASEGGHVDFAPRNADEQTLATALTEEFGRVDVERVVSGPGSRTSIGCCIRINARR